MGVVVAIAAADGDTGNDHVGGAPPEHAAVANAAVMAAISTVTRERCTSPVCPPRAGRDIHRYPSRPMATTERDFYVILGVERNATDAQIKAAFRKAAQKWHPDVNSDPEAQERFKEINEAYQVLSDPEKRSRYDTFGRAASTRALKVILEA